MSFYNYQDEITCQFSWHRKAYRSLGNASFIKLKGEFWWTRKINTSLNDELKVMWSFSKLRQISNIRQGITFQKPWILLNTALNISSLGNPQNVRAKDLIFRGCEYPYSRLWDYNTVHSGNVYRYFGKTYRHSWLRHCATNWKVAGSSPGGVIGIHWQSFRPHYGPGVDLASNRNEYQECLLGGKGGRCVGLTNLPPSCADCLAIWEPQPPGTLRACPGLKRVCFTILPFFCTVSFLTDKHIRFQQHNDDYKLLICAL
jgi:hypothetical protein